MMMSVCLSVSFSRWLSPVKLSHSLRGTGSTWRRAGLIVSTPSLVCFVYCDEMKSYLQSWTSRWMSVRVRRVSVSSPHSRASLNQPSVRLLLQLLRQCPNERLQRHLANGTPLLSVRTVVCQPTTICDVYHPRSEGGIVFSSFCLWVCVSVCLSAR